MAKMLVELTNSASLKEGGRTFHKGQPQLLTNPAEIKQYVNRPGFRVSMIEDKPKPKLMNPERKTPSAEDWPAAVQIPHVDAVKENSTAGFNFDVDTVSGDMVEITAETITETKVEDDFDDTFEIEEPVEKPTIYTKSKLKAMRKSVLVELGLEWDLAFTGIEKTKEMVNDILLAQEENG